MVVWWVLFFFKILSTHARAATVVVGELVSLVARPDAVPYGRCRNLLLETRAKEHFPTGGSNAKMRLKVIG